MSDHPRMRHAPRAGPVAGLPIEPLLARGEELARRWAISLVLARPLDGLADVPLEDLARDAPALCAQCVRALESDEELDRLAGASPAGREDSSPVSRLAAISGAGDASALVEAVEALRGVLWGALLEELRWPTFDQTDAHRVADLSDRLAHVCASALVAALGDGALERDAERDAEEAPPGAEPGFDSQERGPAGGGAAVIVDERDEARAAPRRPPEEIEIRDERGEVGPAAWIGSIGRQLDRFKQDGRSFAVLLVELRDIERLRRDGAPGELAGLADQMEQALASELRRGSRTGGAPGGGAGAHEAPWSGSLTREGPGRYWLLAPQTDRTGVRAMAERLTGAVRTLARHRGAYLEIAIGTAVCPEDGREPAALAAHADLELYAARASARTAVGRSSTSVDEPV